MESPHGPLHEAIRELERLAERARALIVLRRSVGIVAAIAGGLAAAAALDFVFRFPAPLRALVLVAGVAAAAVAAVRLLLPAIRFRPSPMELALRIERDEPRLRGRLASGVEFALAGEDRGNGLAARSVADAAARVAGESLSTRLAPRRSLAELSTALATLALVALVGIVVPGHALIGAQRMLLPFGDHRWPARTSVESLLAGKEHHARGTGLVLSARLAKGDAPRERIVADVEVERADGRRDRQELVLTRQPDGRHERVLEADPSAVAATIVFRSVDDETAATRIAFVEPPAIAAARLRIDPPGYAAESLEPRELDLGDGTDARGRPKEPALVGSRATLSLELATPIEPPASEEARRSWQDRILLAEGGRPELEVDPTDATRWSLSWRVDGPLELAIALEDALGIRAVEEARYRLEAVGDRPPGAVVLEPAADESVLPGAVVPILFEARDDVALARAGAVIRRRPAGQTSGEGEIVRDGRTAVGGTTLRGGDPLALSELGAAPGDVVTVVALAEDGFVGPDGARREPTASAVRTLRIIDEIELGRQLRGQLASVRRAAIRLDQQQAELSAAAANGRFDPALERGQAQVSERLRAADAAVRELSERAARNRLGDEQLAATLAQAEDLLEAAGRVSGGASESMQRRREASAAGDAEAAAEAERAAVAAQEEVRAELEDLIRLLDRDEDSWAMSRQIDRLREEVAELARRTREVGRRTVGQAASALQPQDREELERIASAQAEAARAAAELVDGLRTRAESVDRQDRARADAMREAARAAEEGRLERNLEAAGQDARENRLQQAEQAQQAAAQALDRMRDQLENVRRARTETLRRALESLERSIERLVRQAEDELIALARIAGPDEAEPLAERGRAMAKLAQNTQAVAGEARAAGPEAGRVGRVLDRAADAQGSSVPHLRARPGRIPEATAAEERGLALLREALDGAKATREAVEREEAERRRRELMASYRALFERQAAIRESTDAARPADPTARLDRRGLIESRRLSILQGELGRDVGALEREHPELAESEVFSETNDLVESWASEASGRLGQGDLSEGTGDLQAFILEALATVLSSLDTPEDDDPFQDDREGGEEAGGEGGQAGGDERLVSAIAELKVLRGMQRQVLERTRRLDAAVQEGSAGASADAELAALGRLQGRLVEVASRLVQRLERPALPQEPLPEPEAVVPEHVGVGARERGGES